MATKERLEQALRNAHAAGDTAAASRFADAIRDGEFEDESKSSRASAALQGGGQGATLGFADEAGAGVRAFLAPMLEQHLHALTQKINPSPQNEGKGYGEIRSQYQEDFYPEFVDGSLSGFMSGTKRVYNDSLDSQRGALETAREDHPGTTFAGEMAGGLAGGVAAGGKAIAGQTFKQALPRIAGTGAGVGGVAGLGYSDKESVGDAVKDTAAGAALGGAMAVGGSATGRATSAATQKLIKMLPGGAKRRAADAINKAITEDLQSFDLGEGKFVDISRDQAQDFLSRNPNLTVADLGNATRNLGARVSEGTGEAANTFKTAMNQRIRQQDERVLDSMAKGLGVESRNLPQAMQATMNKAREQVAPIYAELRNTPITIEHKKAIAALRENEVLYPTLKKAMGKAVDIARDEGIDETATGYTMRHLDLVSQALREMSDSARDAGAATAKSDRLSKMRNVFDDLVLPEDDVLRQARSVWRSASADTEAAELAGKIFTEGADFNAERFARMSQSEQAHFRMRILEDVKKKIGNTDVTKGNISSQFTNKKNLRNALRVAFGGEEQFNTVMRDLSDESRMFDTYLRAVFRASPEDAAANNVFGQAMGVMAGTQVGAAAGAHPLMAAGMGRRLGAKMPGLNGMAEKTNQELGPMLLQNTLPQAPTVNPAAGLLGGQTNTLPYASGLLGGMAAGNQ